MFNFQDSLLATLDNRFTWAELKHRAAERLSVFRIRHYNCNYYIASVAITAMRLRSQRPLHVQGDAGHPG
jgi:hypothetical protein